MSEKSERRRVVRLSVPQHLSGPLLEIRLARLLELSAEGVRIEHPDPLREWLTCILDLPPALGRLRLTGRVVWTRSQQSERSGEDSSRDTSYQSGLSFVHMTLEQRAALAKALEILSREDPPTPEKEEEGSSG